MADRGLQLQVDEKADPLKDTLHYACKSGIVGTVSLFMTTSIDLNARDNDGWTVLHHARAKGRKRVVIELSKKVVDLGIDLDGQLSALDRAREEEHFNVISVIK